MFLHGWGASRDSLRGIAALFEPTHAVHLIDLPGFGDAPLPPSAWGTIEYADLVERYCSDRLRGTLVLVGHSFGGRVSIRLGARHLPQVRGLVVMGAPGLPAPALSRAALRRAWIRTLRRAIRAAAPLTGPAPLEWHTRRFGSRDYLAAGAMKDVFVRVVNEDLTSDARRIEVPALLLWGADDREAPASLAWRFRDLMNGHATVDILPHKDHFLYTATGAHLCAFKIRGWLDHVAW